MTATMTSAVRASKPSRPQLTDIVLGSNPNTESRYTQRTGEHADIAEVDFIADGTWSIACNLDRVGPGTIGWIARQGEGGNPPLAGVIVCTSVPELWEDTDDEGNPVAEWYVEGRLHGGLWVSGDDIAAAGWPDRRAPWGRTATRQFQNGESIKSGELRSLLDATAASVARTVALEHRDVTGRLPRWA